VCAVQWDFSLFFGVALDPFDPQMGYLASTDGFQRTGDGGRTIERVDPANGACVAFQSFTADLWQAGRLYGAGFLAAPCAVDAPGCSLFRSDDRGATWQCLGLEEAQSLATAPSVPGLLYVLTGALPLEGDELYVSGDSGATFTKLADVPSFTRLVVDVHDANRLIAVADYTGFWRSVDGGRTWQRIFKWFLEGDGLADLDAIDPHTMYIASADFGVRVSHDDGAHWLEIPPTELLGTVDRFYPAMAVDPSTTGKLYLADWNGVITATVP
jgi:photosystem II stability/assembly factor-like uncharacterized protein